MDGKTPTVVSAAYFEPKGEPPANGWPVLAWAHGTTGVADTCAPFVQARLMFEIKYLNTWLEQGFAVIATDYQGLGVPGPHPYSQVRQEDRLPTSEGTEGGGVRPTTQPLGRSELCGRVQRQLSYLPDALAHCWQRK